MIKDSIHHNWRRGWDVGPKGSRTFRPRNRRCGLVSGAPGAVLLSEGRQRRAKGCPFSNDGRVLCLPSFEGPRGPCRSRCENLEGTKGRAKEALQTCQTGHSRTFYLSPSISATGGRRGTLHGRTSEVSKNVSVWDILK